MITDFEQLTRKLRDLNRRVRVAAVCPRDASSEAALARAEQEGWAEPIVIDHDDQPTAAREAVAAVRGGEADVLMKGLISSAVLLRAVLNKEHGILVKGSVLTHIAVAQIPGMNRLLFFSDAAVIPFPTTEQLDAVTTYITQTWRGITGGDKPRVALTHCTEKISEKFPITLSYQDIKQYAAQGRYGDVCIDGPMDVKTACDAESGAIKGIASPVVGNADILLFPDIEAGNTFYKTITYFAHATVTGMLAGTTAPVVVTSRADSAESKFYSLAVACMRAIR